MKTTTWLITLFIFMLSLSACGKKGPLYLPDEEKTSQQSINKATDLSLISRHS